MQDKKRKIGELSLILGSTNTINSTSTSKSNY